MALGTWALAFEASLKVKPAARVTKKGVVMKKFVLPAAIALALLSAPALAADLGRKMVTKAPPVAAVNPWDIAFGAALMTDYNFRGISQSDRGPSVNAYFEARYNSAANLQWYAGIAGSSVKLATDPSAEIDFYGGVRPTFGPLALDFGFIYYYYPKEVQFGAPGGPPAFFPSGNTTLANTDYWEVYAKGVYTFNDMVAAGFNVYYSPDWLNTGADGTYVSGTLKFTGPSSSFPPNWGGYLSGEVGYYALGTTKFDPVAFPAPGGWDLPSYTYWNVGGGLTYKVFTLDLRYHDTDLSKEECNVLTADPGATLGGTPIPITNTAGALSKWCGSAFIAKLSVDTTLSAIK